MGDDAPMFYETPLELVRGDGVWLDDVDGNRYLDLYNNVPCVGHANKRVVAAMAEQAATLNVHSRYLHDGVLDYVERLVGLHHDGIETAVLACSGTEGSEIALMMARAATGKNGIICTDATYHGNSALISRMSWLPVGTDRSGIRSISTPQLFRPMEQDRDEEELLQLHLDQLRHIIAGLENDGHGFAGLMICSLLANEGLPRAPSGWFQQAVDIVHEAGGLVIADEVQAGFARSGHWWGYQTNNFVPDIVCMGKPMGNGIPLSGVAASHQLVTGFRRKHRYFNTFASSPIQAAAGMAVIDEITDRDLTTQVTEVGEFVRSALEDLQPEHPRMGDVRGQGMFIGVDWVHPGTNEPDVDGARSVVEGLKSRRMLLGQAGQHGNVLKIRPPLVFEQSHGELFLDAFAETMVDAHS